MTESRKYNIAFVLNLNLRFGGGGERALLQYVRNKPSDFNCYVFQTEYYDVQRLTENEIREYIGDTPLLTFQSTETFFPNIRKSDISLMITEIFFTPFYLRITRSRRKKIAQVLKKMDFIYLFSNNYECILNGNHHAIVFGSTHGMSIRGKLAWLEPFFKALLKLIEGRLIYRKISGFHVLRPFYDHDKMLSRKYDFSLPNGVDTSIFHPPENELIRTNRIEFLYVGRLEMSKGIGLLVNAWKLFQNNVTDPQDYVLNVVGTGRGSICLHEVKNIIVHGHLEVEKLAEIYRRSQIFLFPSSGEIYPMVILEALSSGQYVLCSSKIDGVFDEFEKVGSLKYVNTDPDLFSQEMKKTIENFDSLRVPLEKSVELVRKKFEWSRIVEKLYDYIRSSIQQN